MLRYLDLENMVVRVSKAHQEVDGGRDLLVDGIENPFFYQR